MQPLAIITSPRAAEIFYPDQYLDAIVSALDAAGVPARAVAWYESETWTDYGGAVVRSPWCLYWHPEDFLDWLTQISDRMPVANPASVIRWGFDKRYLMSLAQAGVPTVPTSVVEDSEPLLPDSFVIKPALSGGGKGAAVFPAGQDEQARQHAQSIRNGGGLPLLQPYLRDVDADGERGLIYLGGEFSHAIAKTALLSRTSSGRPGHVDAFHPNLTLHQPDAAELAVAAAALAALPEQPLSARIDMIPVSGQPTVLEVEVVDPDLFFHLDGAAFDRYIDAIVRWYSRQNSD